MTIKVTTPELCLQTSPSSNQRLTETGFYENYRSYTNQPLLEVPASTNSIYFILVKTNRWVSGSCSNICDSMMPWFWSNSLLCRCFDRHRCCCRCFSGLHHLTLNCFFCLVGDSGWIQRKTVMLVRIILQLWCRTWPLYGICPQQKKKIWCIKNTLFWAAGSNVPTLTARPQRR